MARDNWRDHAVESGLAGVRPVQFVLIRQILETLCDLLTLADVNFPSPGTQGLW